MHYFQYIIIAWWSLNYIELLADLSVILELASAFTDAQAQALV